MVKFTGWLGANLLAWCGAFALWDVVEKGNADGYSAYFMLSWGLGEILTAYYVYKSRGLDWPLLYNYGFNLAFISFIMYYMI